MRRVIAVFVGLATWAILAANTAAMVRDLRFEDLVSYRRLWADLALAIQYHLDAVQPETGEAGERKRGGTVVAYRRVILERIQIREIEPHQFWRTVRSEVFLRERGPVARDALDDPGRAMVLAAGFRLLRGIAPFLILWLGALAALPLFLWTAGEAFTARRPVAGAAFLLLLALSPFVVETLALTRSSVGFYVLAVTLLTPLGLYGLLGQPTPRGLVLRWAAAAVYFALCTLCRGGALLLLPGFALALLGSLRRLQPPPGWLEGPTRARTMLQLLSATALGTVLFLIPFLTAPAAVRHDRGIALWEGLGDFDRTKGHIWSDPAAEARARTLGAPGLRTPEAERVLGRETRLHIREDPAWYAGILARRLFATATLHRLWPWAPRDGSYMAQSTSPNEGLMNKYYGGYVTTVDFVGFGPRAQWEMPVSLLLLPTVALAALAVQVRQRGPGVRRALVVVGILATACLGLPVAVSTAGGMETQAFALTYFLGAAFLFQELLDLAAASLAARRAPAG